MRPGFLLPSLALACAATLSATLIASPVQTTYRTQRMSKAGFYKAVNQVPRFQSSSAVSSVASRTVASAMAEGYADFAKVVRDMAREGKPAAPYDYVGNATVSVGDTNLISLLVEQYEYTGGAHGNTLLRPHNFGLAGGKAKRLALADILSPGQTAKTLTEGLLLPRLMEIKKARFGSDAGPAPAIDAELVERWLATPAGISWVFEPYAVGAYAEGTYTLKFTWAELGSFLKRSGPLAPVMTAQGGVTDRAITGVEWQLTSFEYSDDTVIKVGSPKDYTLNITPSGRVSMKVDVNRGTALATGGNSQISFKLGGLTRAMPGPGSHHDRFLRDLPNVASYVVKGDMLYLNLKMDGGNLVFRKG